MDAEVVIVGAGPAGLMLASELCLAGVRPVLLERQPQLRQTPKANGFNGQIVEVLRYRGLLDRVEGASGRPVRPAAGAPFGGVHLDFSHLADPPLWAVHLPQPRLERLLGERASELGVDIRRGHEVVGVSQDDATVAADVRGPDGLYQMTARYLAGCDGAHSTVRDTAGIPFPGTTYREINRLAQATVPASVSRLENGDLDVPGLGRIRAGFTRTDRGVFGFGSLADGALLIQTTEDEPAEVNDATPMTLTEFQDSIRRVLGADLPLGEVTRLSRYGFQARQAERYRDGRILLAGDAAHQFPATGIGISVGMLDAVNLAWKLAAAVGGWAPAGLLDTYHSERHFAGARALLQTRAQVALRRGQDPAAHALRELVLELLVDEQPLRRLGALIAGANMRYPMPGLSQHPLAGTFVPDLAVRTGKGTTSVAELMHTARPTLLDLADRSDIREAARDWQHRIDVCTAETDHCPADALLIRPDAHIAWAAATGEASDTAAPALREALSRWFGQPGGTFARERADGRSDSTSCAPVLVEPSSRMHASFLQALREYRAEGLYQELDPAQLADTGNFRRYLDAFRADADPHAPRDEGLVPQTTLWLAHGDQYLGRLSIRHVLTEQLRHEGGHIGYEVRPAQRRRGYATLMLRLALPIANQLGINPALLTCDATNFASRRVIKANGGHLIDASDGILRFWVPTSQQHLSSMAP